MTTTAERTRLLRGGTSGGVVHLNEDAELHTDGAETPARTEVPDLVVAASGNLANIYFTEVRERVSLEGIARLHPRLLPGLVRHEGIGFVMVRSEEHGPLVISRDGVRNLESGTVEGTDPLEHYGEHAAANLGELDTYEHIGDVFVILRYDPSTQEVAPFEHQVGSHGGLGGMQTKAFVLYPAAFATGEKTVSLVGAPEVNRKIHEWIARARELHAAGPTPEVTPAEEETQLPSVLRTASSAE